MQSIDRHTVMASSGYDLKRFCAPLGIDIEALAKPLNIDINSFSDLDATIGFNKFCLLLEAASSLAGDDCFGIRYADFCRFGGSGPFTMALATARDFEELVQFYLKYARIVGNFSHFSIHHEDGSIKMRNKLAPEVARHVQYVDFAIFSQLKIVNHYYGADDMLQGLRLERKKPRDDRLHRAAFGRNIEYSAPCIEIIFSEELLTRANPKHEQNTYQFMVRRCEEIKAALTGNDDVVDIVRDSILARLQTADARIGEIAREIGMSERSLQRKLDSRQMTFSSLMESVRDELSCRLLKETELPIAEISRRTGYASPNTYSRAVTKNHKISPRNLRVKLRS